MPRQRTGVRRYAEAAFEIGQRDGTVETWLDQLDRAAAVAADPGSVARLQDPAVPFSARAEALMQALGGDLVPPVRNLLLLLMRRRRVDQLDQLAAEFRRLYNRRAGIVQATAISAAPLEPDQLDALRERVVELAGHGRSVELHTEVDPHLLGGLQVRIGDRLIDGSVRGRLERLRNQLAARA
ncbi:MAG: F0F1 ATP synthase subunit delta [Chloroflexota bacterium]|nr:F0F1 ATP synthase subunit delta [Chloroflexota bacterium]